jgi:hypothetical protein
VVFIRIGLGGRTMGRMGAWFVASIAVLMAVTPVERTYAQAIPTTLDEQNDLQVVGTTVETPLYSYQLPAGTLTSGPAGKRVHTSVEVHLSNGDVQPHYYTLNIYFGGKKIGILSDVYLSISGNLGVRIDSFLHAATVFGEPYVVAQTIAYEYAFDYGGSTGTTLQQYQALSAEALVETAEADPSQPIEFSVTVALPTADGKTYGVLGHGVTILE